MRRKRPPSSAKEFQFTDGEAARVTGKTSAGRCPAGAATDGHRCERKEGICTVSKSRREKRHLSLQTPRRRHHRNRGMGADVTHRQRDTAAGGRENSACPTPRDLHPNPREHRARGKLRDVPQDPRPAFSKSIEVTRDQQRRKRSQPRRAGGVMAKRNTGSRVGLWGRTGTRV